MSIRGRKSRKTSLAQIKAVTAALLGEFQVGDEVVLINCASVGITEPEGTRGVISGHEKNDKNRKLGFIWRVKTEYTGDTRDPEGCGWHAKKHNLRRP